MIKEILGGLVAPITKAYNKRQDRKQAKEQAVLKIQQANADANNELNLTDAEWENISTSKQDSSWKDEFLTIVIPAPYILIILGAIVAAYTGDASMLDGVKNAMKVMEEIGVDVGFLMEAVVLAGVGLKVWRAGR